MKKWKIEMEALSPKPFCYKTSRITLELSENELEVNETKEAEPVPHAWSEISVKVTRIK